MREQLGDLQEGIIERLQFNILKAGDVITIVTGTDEQAWRYIFTVKSTEGNFPVGELIAFAPDGSITEPIDFSLHGAGNWTNKRQNPVQTQDHAFTSPFNCIYLRGFMIGQFAGEDNRAIFDRPGQEISEIKVERETDQP